MRRGALCLGLVIAISQLILICLFYNVYSDVLGISIPQKLFQRFKSFRIKNSTPLSSESTTAASRRCWANSMFCEEVLREPSWLPIDQRNSKFVFSAFYDKKASTVIIVGLNSRFLEGVCQMWYTSDNDKVIAMEESGIEFHKKLPESHGHRYFAVLYRCPSTLKRKPTFVSFVETDRYISKGIPVKSMEIPETYKRTFTVCLMPLHNNFNDSYTLVQWIELNLIFGADKFVIYNYSSSANIKTILDLYTERNITEVVQWPIPVADVHYFGQVAALQDCLYRNKAESEFVVNLDLDEFIVPRKEDINTWSELIENSSAGAFVFRNTFFVNDPQERNFFGKASAQHLQLSALLMSRHESKIWPHRLRSKYIARTSTATSLMIHDVPWDGNNRITELVPPERAMVYHYRERASKPDNATNYILDETIRLKYGQLLINNVQRAWDLISHG